MVYGMTAYLAHVLGWVERVSSIKHDVRPQNSLLTSQNVNFNLEGQKHTHVENLCQFLSRSVWILTSICLFCDLPIMHFKHFMHVRHVRNSSRLVPTMKYRINNHSVIIVNMTTHRTSNEGPMVWWDSTQRSYVQGLPSTLIQNPRKP